MNASTAYKTLLCCPDSWLTCLIFVLILSSCACLFRHFYCKMETPVNQKVWKIGVVEISNIDKTRLSAYFSDLYTTPFRFDILRLLLSLYDLTIQRFRAIVRWYMNNVTIVTRKLNTVSILMIYISVLNSSLKALWLYSLG